MKATASKVFSELQAQYAGLMDKVVNMPAGDDLESLLEQGTSEIKTMMIRQAVETRQKTSEENSEGFPPSRVSKMREKDAQKSASAKSRSANSGRKTRV